MGLSHYVFDAIAVHERWYVVLADPYANPLVGIPVEQVLVMVNEMVHGPLMCRKFLNIFNGIVVPSAPAGVLPFHYIPSPAGHIKPLIGVSSS